MRNKKLTVEWESTGGAFARIAILRDTQAVGDEPIYYGVTEGPVFPYTQAETFPIDYRTLDGAIDFMKRHDNEYVWLFTESYAEEGG